MPKPGSAMTSALAMAATLAIGAVGPSWASDYSIDGDADSMTLVAKQASRAAIVEALVERFSIGIGGAAVGDGEVNGRYEGNLSHVLKSILPDRSYAIAYRDGRPFRISFTGTGSRTAGAMMQHDGGAMMSGETASGPSPSTTTGNPAGAASFSRTEDIEQGPSPMATTASANTARDAPATADPSPTPFGAEGTTMTADEAVESSVAKARQDDGMAGQATAETAPAPSPMAESGTAETRETADSQETSDTQDIAPVPSATNSAAASDDDMAGISTEAPIGFRGPDAMHADHPGGESTDTTDMASQPGSGQASRPPM